MERKKNKLNQWFVIFKAIHSIRQQQEFEESSKNENLVSFALFDNKYLDSQAIVGGPQFVSCHNFQF